MDLQKRKFLLAHCPCKTVRSNLKLIQVVKDRLSNETACSFKQTPVTFITGRDKYTRPQKEVKHLMHFAIISFFALI